MIDKFKKTQKVKLTPDQISLLDDGDAICNEDSCFKRNPFIFELNKEGDYILHNIGSNTIPKKIQLELENIDIQRHRFCRCKKAKFTRTVTENYDLTCGRCNKELK